MKNCFMFCSNQDEWFIAKLPVNDFVIELTRLIIDKIDSYYVSNVIIGESISGDYEEGIELVNQLRFQARCENVYESMCDKINELETMLRYIS